MKRIVSTLIFCSFLLVLFSLPILADASIYPLESLTQPEEGKTYSISNFQQLEYLQGLVNSGNACEGVNFVLTNDIVMNENSFSLRTKGKSCTVQPLPLWQRI